MLKIANDDDQNKIVQLVNTLMAQNIELYQTLVNTNKYRATRRQIDATDRQIDQLVYQLYDLTDEEVKIVEGDVAKN